MGRGGVTDRRGIFGWRGKSRRWQRQRLAQTDQERWREERLFGLTDGRPVWEKRKVAPKKVEVVYDECVCEGGVQEMGGVFV